MLNWITHSKIFLRKKYLEYIFLPLTYEMISTYQAKIQISKHMQGLFDIKCLDKSIIVAMRVEGLMWYFRVI